MLDVSVVECKDQAGMSHTTQINQQMCHNNLYIKIRVCLFGCDHVVTLSNCGGPCFVLGAIGKLSMR
jgi:hypothetical protein